LILSQSHLLVLREAKKIQGKSPLWTCVCDCGSIRDVRASHLKSGSTKSCGCLQSKRVDLTGQRFGLWTALKETGDRRNGAILWLCQCDCGTLRKVKDWSLRTGRSRGCGCNRIYTNASSGEDHYNWTGEIAGYSALHTWVKTHKPKQKLCSHCKQEKELQLANISQEYRRDINDFMWLCGKCHKAYDMKSERKKELVKRFGKARRWVGLIDLERNKDEETDCVVDCVVDVQSSGSV